MRQTHQGLPAVPAGERGTGQPQRLGQHQRDHGPLRVDERVRALGRVGVGVGVHLQGQGQHRNAHRHQYHVHEPWRTEQ